MTIGGTVNKTAMSLAILLVAAMDVWGRGVADDLPMGLVIGGVIGGFVVALVTAFKQTWAPYTKYMEWYGGFGLLVTLVWLYLEILRLLAKLQSRD